MFLEYFYQANIDPYHQVSETSAARGMIDAVRFGLCSGCYRFCDGSLATLCYCRGNGNGSTQPEELRRDGIHVFCQSCRADIEAVTPKITLCVICNSELIFGSSAGPLTASDRKAFSDFEVRKARLLVRQSEAVSNERELMKHDFQMKRKRNFDEQVALQRLLQEKQREEPADLFSAATQERVRGLNDCAQLPWLTPSIADSVDFTTFRFPEVYLHHKPSEIEWDTLLKRVSSGEIELLDLSNSSLLCSELIELIDRIKDSPNCRLSVLKMRGNSISMTGGTHLLLYLVQNVLSTPLRVVVLKYNHLSPELIKAIKRQLEIVYLLQSAANDLSEQSLPDAQTRADLLNIARSAVLLDWNQVSESLDQSRLS